MTTIDLWFPLAEVLEIAEHAVAAPGHRQSITQYCDDQPGTAALVWAKDDGTYLLSSGLPRQVSGDPESQGGSRVAFAEGWGQGTGPELGATPVGGDDFAEFLPLLEPDEHGTTLIDMIRAHEGTRWMVITTGADQFSIWFASRRRRSH